MRAFFFIPVAVFILTGCSSFHIKQDQAKLAASFAEHKSQMERFKSWQAKGKIGIRIDDQGSSAFFDWRQKQLPSTNHEFDITLSGPFGQGGVTITGDNKQVTLEHHNKYHTPLVAKTPEALIEQETGWPLPATPLKHWMLGIADPNHAAKLTLNSQQTAASIEQLGWLVEYRNYQLIDHQWLPKKIVLTHLTSPQSGAPSLSLKVIIKKWTLN